jgi:transcriptional regulator with XRE-family HTH domain
VPSSSDALRALGQLIREARAAAGLTQEALGARAGIVGKYVSEIERGTRDIPFSTLHAVTEKGLGLSLDVAFRQTSPAGAAAVDEIARLIAALPDESRARVLQIVRMLVSLVADQGRGDGR